MIVLACKSSCVIKMLNSPLSSGEGWFFRMAISGRGEVDLKNYLPTRICSMEPNTPNALRSQSTVTMITTIFRILFIFPSMGI
jgi:hypothetical protein